MLLAAVSVLVVVASGDPADGATSAIEQALRTALVRDASIVVRAAATDTSDDAIVAMAATEHATLVGLVSWSDHQRKVIVHFARLPEGRWTDREVRFDAADVAAERGRTVGFALASMMPDDAFAERADAPPPPAALPVADVAQGFDGDARTPERPRTPAIETLPPSNPLALDATALAAVAPTGYGGGVGGQFAVRFPLAGALGGHAAVSARAEAIGPAAATARTVGGAIGVAWQPWLDSRRRWAAGVRVDALVLWVDVAHLDEDDREAAHLSRFQGGLDAALEGTFRFAEHAAIVAGLGSEVAFGSTAISVKGRQVTTLPPAKLLTELGIRVSFR